jgi:hypothetical protein
MPHSLINKPVVYLAPLYLSQLGPAFGVDHCLPIPMWEWAALRGNTSRTVQFVGGNATGL